MNHYIDMLLQVVHHFLPLLNILFLHDGKVYHQRFENGGKPATGLEIIDECSIERTGTTVRFKADFPF